MVGIWHFENKAARFLVALISFPWLIVLFALALLIAVVDGCVSGARAFSETANPKRVLSQYLRALTFRERAP